MANNILIDLDSLKEQLHYDPDTGVFRWRITRHRIISGGIAGFFRRGYVRIKLYGVQYSAHRLAWFYMTGKWPEEQIDHKNRNKADNRFENLREATRIQNRANSKTLNKHGLKGVYHHPWLKENPYEARIKNKSLGCFPTPEAAHEAYKKEHIALHGRFSNL